MNHAVPGLRIERRPRPGIRLPVPSGEDSDSGFREAPDVHAESVTGPTRFAPRADDSENGFERSRIHTGCQRPRMWLLSIDCLNRETPAEVPQKTI